MRRARSLIVVLALLASSVLVWNGLRPQADLGPTGLIGATKLQIAQGNDIALYFGGRMDNESTDPSHFVFTGDVISLATGEVVGTMTHDVTCSTSTPPPCAVLDAVNTFRFADGTIVNGPVPESQAPDPQHRDELLIGNHQSGNTITSGTGRYAGRTGRARMSGRHNIAELFAPKGSVVFDDFWMIELDPR